MNNKQAESDRTIKALESDNADSLSFEELQIHKLGQDLRTLADADMPDPNESLREHLTMKLGEQEQTTHSKKDVPLKPVKSESRLGWKLALAGCLLLAVSVAAMMMPGGAMNMTAKNELDRSHEEVQAASRQATLSVKSESAESPEQWNLRSNRDESKVRTVDKADQGQQSQPAYGDSAGAIAGQKQNNGYRDLQVSGNPAPQQQPANETLLEEDALGDLTDSLMRAVDGKNKAEEVQLQYGFEEKSKIASMAVIADQSKLQPQSWRKTAGASGNTIASRDAGGIGALGNGRSESQFGQMGGGGSAGGGFGGGGRGGGGGGGVYYTAPAKNSPAVIPPTQFPAGVAGLGSDGLVESKKLAEFGESASGQFRGEERSRRGGRGYENRKYRHRVSPRYEASGEQYEPIHENSFYKVAGGRALSTFSIDVDTASYSNMRRFLQSGQRPPRNAIRIEELVNYFNYDYPQPEGDRPFAVDMELASCPWNERHHLLRVALQGKEIHRSERAATNLVFLLDVSGSMQDQNKLPLLKQGLMMMVQQLTENDSVSIVTYSGSAGVKLEPTNGSNKRQIEKAIEQLNAGGSTNGSAVIEMAYELAQKQFIQGGSNRVVMATDGDLNVGITDDNALVELIKRKASEGVFLTVLGFGTGNLKDGKLEKLADNGNGMYAYIDSFREAHKVLIEQMSGSLETIAKDVKLQIEFNPGEVRAYRLIGYENRVMAAKDFKNDKKDAGEIGAGHTVTALYELELAGGAAEAAAVQGLKYQQKEEPEVPEAQAAADNGYSGELLTLSLRYKQPEGQESQQLDFVLKNEPTSFSSASSDFQFAAAVASFGMMLRGSQHQGQTSIRWVEETASRSCGEDVGGYRAEFIDLVRRAGGTR